MKTSTRLLSLVAPALLLVPSILPAQAALPPAPVVAPATASGPRAEEPVLIDPFTVYTTTDEGFRATDASSATRIAVDLRDAPLSISVMPREVLTDLMPVDIKQGMYYGPGITGGALNRNADRPDGIYRGITENSVFSDGTPLLGTGRYDEPFELERIEIIRGPSGVTFGSGFFGGLANRVSKQPLFTRKGHVRLMLDDNNLLKGAIDVTGPLRPNFAYRVIASYTKGKLSDKLYDDYRHRFLRTAFTWRATPNTTLTANLKYRSYYSVLNLMGDFLEGNTMDTIYRFDAAVNSSARNLYDTDTKELQAWFTLTHNIGDWLSLRTLGAYTKVDDVYHFAVPTPGGPFRDAQGAAIPRPAGVLNNVFDWLDIHAENSGFEQDALLKYNLGALKNKTLATLRLTGLSNGQDENRRRIGFFPFRYKDGMIGIADNFNPFASNPKSSVLPLSWSDQDRSPSLTTSLQHFMTLWNGRLHLTGGVSRDEQKGREKSTTGTVVTVLPIDFKSGNILRYGASVRAADWLTIYGQYNEGFRAPSPRVDRINGTVFGPMKAQSRELGFRTFFLGDRLSLEGAAYKIDLVGIIQAFPDSATQGSFQRGGDASKGWELILQGEILPQWSIMASINHNDYVQGNGERVRLSVADYGNLYTKYRFRAGTLKGLSAGVGTWWKRGQLDGYYTVAGQKHARYFPAAQVVDLVLSYDYKPFTFGVTVNNLFDKFYYTSNSSNIFFRGFSRHASFTLDYRF